MRHEKRNPHMAGSGNCSRLGGRTQSNPIEIVLHALERATGHTPSRSGKSWRSRCTSCGGKSEKVAIAEAETGAVMMHAFCGCETAAVLGDCGLTLADLFPKRLEALTAEQRSVARQAMKEAGWRAALSVLTREASVALIAARYPLRGETLTGGDLQRLELSVQRIDDARAVLA